MGLYAIGRVFLDADWQPLGWLGAALAAATVYCTAMIYTSIKAVPRWHSPLTPLHFLTLAAAGGALQLRVQQVLQPVGVLDAEDAARAGLENEADVCARDVDLRPADFKRELLGGEAVGLDHPLVVGLEAVVADQQREVLEILPAVGRPGMGHDDLRVLLEDCGDGDDRDAFFDSGEGL